MNKDYVETVKPKSFFATEITEATERKKGIM